MDWIMIFHLLTESPNPRGAQACSNTVVNFTSREAVHRRAQGDADAI